MTDETSTAAPPGSAAPTQTTQLAAAPESDSLLRTPATPLPLLAEEQVAPTPDPVATVPDVASPAPQPAAATDSSASDRLAILTAQNADLQRQLLAATQAAAAPTVQDDPPAPAPTPDRSVLIGRALLPEGASDATALQAHNAYREEQLWANYVDHPEHGAQAKQKVAAAQALLQQLNTRAQHESLTTSATSSVREEMAALNKRLDELTASQSRPQQAAAVRKAITPQQLASAYPKIAAREQADPGYFDRVTAPIDFGAIVLTDPASWAALDQHLALIESAIQPVAAHAPQASTTTHAQVPPTGGDRPGLSNPAALLPRDNHAQAQPHTPQYSTAADRATRIARRAQALAARKALPN